MSKTDRLAKFFERIGIGAIDAQGAEASLNRFIGPILLPQIASGLKKLFNGKGGRSRRGRLTGGEARDQDERQHETDGPQRKTICHSPGLPG